MKMMTKGMKGLAVLTAAVLMFAFVGQAGAYCVHNYSDAKMSVQQTSNPSEAYVKSFKVTLPSGDSACCNWQNKDCNSSGGQNDPVGFDVSRVVDWWFDKKVCTDFIIPANGVFFIKGSNGNYNCSQNP